MGKHLIVMSVDAMVFEDLAYLKEKPYFRRLMEDGSRVERVRTIYPSLTHPVHASIMTGCYPDRTGVCNNAYCYPGGKGAWYNALDEVRVPTIFHAAKKAGLTSCVCRWPMTSGGSDVIDYLVPEITDEILGEDLAAPYRRQGTREALLQEIVLPILKSHSPEEPKHPSYDTSQIEMAAEIIRRYRPNLVFTHPGQVDHARHQNGLFNDRVNAALDLAEEYLGMLMRAAEDAGIYEETDFIVLSDHGQMEILRKMCPNVLLADAGFIRTDEAGKLESWDAVVQSSGISAQVRLARPEDEELKDRVYQYLLHLKEEGIYGIGQVLTAEEAKTEHHLAGDFSFVLESDGFSSIGEEWVRPIVRPLDVTDYRYGRATHGHLPCNGPQPPFLCAGPSFKKGVVIKEGKIVDEAPTMARALGIEMPWTDGDAMEELLAE
ncbi:MAG: alkaline phosphatase family protein [Lachnospiraceae bacterium]|nr:alkaline phosphatase family protein [Lachnospiraceae bacterium]